MRDRGFILMRRAAPWAFLLLIPAGPAAQDLPLQHAVSVINIEIPVRVYKGDAFVDNLTLKDFQVFENGKPQPIDAVYLVRKTDIARGEGQKSVAPQVSRQFVLFFEMSDYLAELDTVLEFFFDKVILPGDSLIVVTPMSRYVMRASALTSQPRNRIKDQLRGRLRADILRGNSEYVNTIRDLDMALSDTGRPLEEKMDIYSTYLAKLETLRQVDEKNLIQFADYLKSLAGQKHVYLFYQKERVPKYNPQELDLLITGNMDNIALQFQLLDKFQFFTRDIEFNVDAVKKAYADSSIAVHFLFLTKTPSMALDITSQRPSGLSLVEQSEDIYSAFREIAGATGGISDTSANAASAFRRAVDASENYYLIYYKPKDDKADGTFRTLTVKVASGNYRVTHRAGYLAK